MLLNLSRGIDRVTEFVGKAVMWLILLSVLVSAGNAIILKMFSISSNAWLELRWYLFGAAFMLAAAYTLKQNEHVRVDVFYASRSRTTQHWIDLFGHVFFLLPFVVLMTWLLVPYFLQAYSSGEVSSNSSGLIIWPARAFLLAGFCLLVLQAISEIIKKIAVIAGLMEDPHPTLSAKEAAELEVAALVQEIKK
ncbi:TRAP transporter small permease subunit [Tabrizicola sp.]|uniref:TRAP transporter small permease subunit n=1 Tax=Tabrizicola sp. TaxID=2005166 RepID=UPI003F414131